MGLLHDIDFYSWTQEQATLLRRVSELRLNELPELDWLLLAEEIEDLGKSVERELYSRYQALLLHLLKWRHQPVRRSRSWELAITMQRREIERLVRKNPSLKPKREEELAEAYPGARDRASSETGLAHSIFPKQTPFTLAEVESFDFWPNDLYASND